MANEKRLIDANALYWRAEREKMVELFPNWKELPQEVKDMLCKHGKEFERLLKEAPTVDAVEVVRCKDCKRRYIPNSPTGKPFCTAQFLMEAKDDDFCSYGERREGE